MGRIWLCAGLSAAVRRGWPLLGIAAMAAYLLLHREKSFWKALGLATLCSVGLFLACWGISWSQGGYLARYVASMALEIASGYWDRLFYWLSLWLVIVCTVLSSWEVVRTILQTWVKNRSLELKDQLVMENYRSLEERLREEAAVRHESSHTDSVFTVQTALRLPGEARQTKSVPA